jgi:hemerythrin
LAGISSMIKTSELIWQDTQHQILFKLIDQINEEPFDYEILVNLRLYAEHHFSIEEAYMVELSYPHAEEHIKAHDRFREELASLLESQDSMNNALRKALSLFLSKWLNLHVFGIDKEFEAFVLKSKYK